MFIKFHVGIATKYMLVRVVIFHDVFISTDMINNAIFKHVYEENHSIPLSDDKFSVVCKVNDTNKRKLIESILIQNSNNFNINQCNFKLDSFTNTYVKHNVPYIKNVLDKVNEISNHNVDVT